MDLEAIDTAQVAVIITDYFVHLQVPAFDRLILSAGEEIRMLFGELKCADGIDVSSQ